MSRFPRVYGVGLAWTALRPYPAFLCAESKHMSIYASLITLIPDSGVNPRNLPFHLPISPADAKPPPHPPLIPHIPTA